MLTIGSLFSGIGGLELGLEQAGLGTVVFQCEIDPFCRAVLAKHWPTVTRFEDVTERRAWPAVDLICGGFPCQDVSSAGKRKGLGGERSGLWYHFARVVSEVRPRFVVVENVASGAPRWLRPVRHQLHLFGYRTKALGIAASDCGAPHRRSRVFVLAYDNRRSVDLSARGRIGQGRAHTAIPGDDGAHGSLAHTDRQSERHKPVDAEVARASSDAADAHSEPRGERYVGASPGAERARRSVAIRGGLCDCGHPIDEHWSGDCLECSCINGVDVADVDTPGREGPGPGALASRERPAAGGWWALEPNVDRVAYELSGGLDGRKRRQRLRALGNAVVPACAQVVGEVIKQLIGSSTRGVS